MPAGWAVRQAEASTNTRLARLCCLAETMRPSVAIGYALNSYGRPISAKFKPRTSGQLLAVESLSDFTSISLTTSLTFGTLLASIMASFF